MDINPSLPVGVFNDLGGRPHLFGDRALVPVANRLRFLLSMTAEAAKLPIRIDCWLLHERLPQHPFYYRQRTN
jgi:hypothetical protein